MHIIVPKIMVPSARLGLPAVRRKLLSPMPSDWKMKPKQMICTKVFVRSQSSSVVPMPARMGSMRSPDATAMMTAMLASSVAEFPSVRSTWSFSPFPN